MLVVLIKHEFKQKVSSITHPFTQRQSAVMRESDNKCDFSPNGNARKCQNQHVLTCADKDVTFTGG